MTGIVSSSFLLPEDVAWRLFSQLELLPSLSPPHSPQASDDSDVGKSIAEWFSFAQVIVAEDSNIASLSSSESENPPSPKSSIQASDDTVIGKSRLDFT